MSGGVLLYDPDCGFCTRAAVWLVRRGASVAVRPLTDAEVAARGLDATRVLREVPFVAASGDVEWGSDAIAAALASCRRPWSWVGRLIRTPWVRPPARDVYGWVAANRHRLPGGSASCRVE